VIRHFARDNGIRWRVRQSNASTKRAGELRWSAGEDWMQRYCERCGIRLFDNQVNKLSAVVADLQEEIANLNEIMAKYKDLKREQECIELIMRAVS
jgi:hypothetical protein